MNKLSNSLTLPDIGFISNTGLELPDGLSADEWREAGLQIARMRGVTQWWIGDWWAFGEHRYGDRKATVESDEWDGPSFETCRNMATIARAFEMSRRRDVLSFNHHAEVAALPIEWQDQLLNEAEKQNLSVAKLRQRVKEVRAFLSQGWTPDQLERRQLVEDGNPVVASQRAGKDDLARDRALIDWADANECLVRIDRQSDWGNPFVLEEDGDRDAVIENYRWYLDRKPSLKRKIGSLAGKVLVCWCYPERCHGDILCERVLSEDAP
ncbi:hypothetical protein BMJ34_02545 [Sinorhizobium medicae]|uniref:DUF4326 domain-containing protein n=1 Tax=Sinorhizobium medicae TaxID=110321 RepID=A0ABX4TPU8_9HYPH|nr:MULTISPECIES: DUF4326 domain-containing protein [Sinorhizobium]PLU04541.1 hypothetical protein BMJ33_11810 [Sinorhizobium medicae]PLU08428.1 hypothetical protein BMJ34_02545 [Sinorhizobium medicae]PLU16202.1 hypothetical protein BMJ30_18235 [Sinorhizobium medicae]PLU20181.1 hypothetical protein BMJ29_13665 [Sinorhizobium medicae]PLU30896.1 hypothetical protein BMJ27_22725 [Sinorhizobium medicae]